MVSKSYEASYCEAGLRLGVGILLWSVSALLSLNLFLSFSDRTITQNLLLAATALGLESTKILCWRNPRTRVFSVVLIALSIIASLGAALEVVDATAGALHTTTLAEIEQNPAYQAKTDEIASIDTEVNTLIIRLGQLPSDYTTAASRISATLTERRTSKQALLDSLSSLSAPSETPAINSMFVHLGRFFHILPETVMFIILLVMAGTLEVGGIILTSPVSIRQKQAVNEPSVTETGKDTKETPPTQISTSYAPPTDDAIAKPNRIGPAEFLEAAKCDGPYLRGRDKTAKNLGISYGEAKRLVSALISDGRIKVYGKRLVLNEQKAS